MTERSGPVTVSPPGRSPDFRRGLLTAVVQDATSDEVLMVAHMDQEAYEATVTQRAGHLPQPQPNRLWVKGEQSGNVMEVVELRLDCDGDAVLLRVVASGPACHTGSRSCRGRSRDAPR